MDERPFTDVRPWRKGFSIPELKWRELVFIGALRPEGREWVRDPDRSMPRFEDHTLFRPGSRYRLASRARGRVHLLPV